MTHAHRYANHIRRSLTGREDADTIVGLETQPYATGDERAFGAPMEWNHGPAQAWSDALTERRRQYAAAAEVSPGWAPLHPPYRYI